MQTNVQGSIEQIEARLTAIQQSHILLQEKLKQAQNNLDRHIDDSTLRVIDILDLIATIQPEMTDKGSSALIINKIQKRLTDILRHWQVQEINVNDGRIQAGKTRVVETRQASDGTPSGEIIEVCRKGYQRGNKTIRPTDVISAR